MNIGRIEIGYINRKLYKGKKEIIFKIWIMLIKVRDGKRKRNSKKV